MIKTKIAIWLLVVTSSCLGQNANSQTDDRKDAQPTLRKELKAFEPFLGTWVIDDKWKDGRPIWARNVYTIGMDGNFVMAKTFTKNPDGKEYQRYLTIWRWDKDKEKVVSHGFTHDGEYATTEPTIDESDEGKPAVSSITSTKGSPVALHQTVKLIDESSYRWTVATSASKDAVIMDGVWRKQE